MRDACSALTARLGVNLSHLARERRESVAWLRSLAAPHWESAHLHPRIGPIRAGDLFASWAAHDARHLGQISKRLHEMTGAAGFSVAYAG